MSGRVLGIYSIDYIIDGLIDGFADPAGSVVWSEFFSDLPAPVREHFDYNQMSRSEELSNFFWCAERQSWHSGFHKKNLEILKHIKNCRIVNVGFSFERDYTHFSTACSRIVKEEDDCPPDWLSSNISGYVKLLKAAKNHVVSRPTRFRGVRGGSHIPPDGIFDAIAKDECVAKNISVISRSPIAALFYKASMAKEAPCTRN